MQTCASYNISKCLYGLDSRGHHVLSSRATKTIWQ